MQDKLSVTQMCANFTVMESMKSLLNKLALINHSAFLYFKDKEFIIVGVVLSVCGSFLHFNVST